MPEVDLEALAAGYRHRPTSAAARRRAARAWQAAGAHRGDFALDIGGGRGEHAETWDAAGARAVVIDPSVAMSAAAHGRVPAIRGRAEHLPIRSATASLAYFHMSIHHCDWRAAIAEAARVLRPGGLLVIWSWVLGPGGYSHLGKWFPSIVTIDVARFPDLGDVADLLPEAGFEQPAEATEVEWVVTSAGAWTAAVENGFVSTLQLVPPDELQAGLDAFWAAHPDPGQRVRYRRYFGSLTAARSLP